MKSATYSGIGGGDEIQLTVRLYTVQRFSKPPPSATRPPLRREYPGPTPRQGTRTRRLLGGTRRRLCQGSRLANERQTFSSGRPRSPAWCRDGPSWPCTSASHSEIRPDPPCGAHAARPSQGWRSLRSRPGHRRIPPATVACPARRTPARLLHVTVEAVAPVLLVLHLQEVWTCPGIGPNPPICHISHSNTGTCARSSDG